MRWLWLALGLAACGPTESPPLPRLGTVEGPVAVPEGLGGDAWLFLYQPHEGPPGLPAVPAFATAVSRGRLPTDPRFVFSRVEPNPYRLWGLLDVNGNFDPEIDVLAQAGAGDRIGEGVEVNVQPGRVTSVSYEARRQVVDEPPAFRLQDATVSDVRLFDAPGSLTVLTLVADPLGRLDPARTAFTLGLVDANNDQRPDDADQDGIPDLSLTLFLHWLPRPGQAPAGTTVVVPMVFNPAPFLATLDGSLEARVLATTLQVTLVPQAFTAGSRSGGLSLEPFGSPPPGDYELVALSTDGRFWRLPNQLAAAEPTQGVRFHFDRTGP